MSSREHDNTPGRQYGGVVEILVSMGQTSEENGTDFTRESRMKSNTLRKRVEGSRVTSLDVHAVGAGRRNRLPNSSPSMGVDREEAGQTVTTVLRKQARLESPAKIGESVHRTERNDVDRIAECWTRSPRAEPHAVTYPGERVGFRALPSQGDAR